MSKRANGEGHISKRLPNGRYRGRVTLGWENGKQVRKSFYGATRAEVRALIDEAVAAREAGEPVSESDQPLRLFLDFWLEQIVRADLKPTTYENYLNLTKNHILPVLGDIPLRDLTAQRLVTFKASKLAAGRSKSLVEHVLILLRIALNHAKNLGLVKKNVAERVELPQPEPHEYVIVSKEETMQFLQANKDDRLFALYMMDSMLGMRRGELLGLRWQDVDLDKALLSVTGQIQRAGGVLHRWETKTRSGERVVAIPRILLPVLSRHALRQKEERLHRGARWRDTGYVFTNTIGGPIEPRRLDEWFKKAVAHAGLPTMRLHDLRHSVATLLLEEGVDMKQISDLLGHSDVSITRKLYIRRTARLRQQPADKMDDLYSSLADDAKPVDTPEPGTNEGPSKAV